MQQIIRAFGRVEGSMQYLLKAWPTIIELMSVYKRLREFQANLNNDMSKTFCPIPWNSISIVNNGDFRVVL